MDVKAVPFRRFGWLALLLFVAGGVASAYAACPPRSDAEMRSYLIDLQNYTKMNVKLLERVAAGSVIARSYSATYVSPYRSVELTLLNYADNSTAASDAMAYPTTVEGEGWNSTVFHGHQAYERAVELVSSEYLEYTAELRVVEGCLVLRGFWHEKIRRYEPLVTLEEGRRSVETVVGAIAENIFGPPSYTPEPPSTPPAQMEERPRVVVVANSIDYSLAAGFLGFLEGRGLEVERVHPGEFERYRTEPFIVILGGPDAPEGTGEIVRELLTMAEGEAVREAGAQLVYVKRDRWAEGQRIIIIAGSDRTNTAGAASAQREEVASQAEAELLP